MRHPRSQDIIRPEQIIFEHRMLWGAAGLREAQNILWFLIWGWNPRIQKNGWLVTCIWVIMKDTLGDRFMNCCRNL
jgi:hypothetical protein